MHPVLAWGRFAAVAAGYAAAFVAARRFVPFSLTSPAFVTIAMICFLGLAFVAQPLVMIRMPGPLRRTRPWEAGGAVYRALGVRAYGAVLRRTPLRLFNTDVYLRNGLTDSARVGAEIEAAEASHFLAAVLVAPYMVYLAVRGMWAPFFWISLAQVLINVYPILHLRQARLRFDRLASIRQARRAHAG